MANENHNPWAVPCVQAFNFLCCPECVYRSREESSFQSHAIQNHPKSRTLFQPEPVEKLNESNVNLHYCCPECGYRSEDVNMFQIHALENHPRSLPFFTDDSPNDKSSKSLSNSLQIPIFKAALRLQSTFVV